MKFFTIILNKTKRVLIVWFCVSYASVFVAQDLTNSPYSRFGIGDLQATQSPRNVAMGGLSVGLGGTSNLSSKNPASYINLDSLMVNFEVGFTMTYSTLRQDVTNEGRISANTNKASLGQLTFAVPITNWLKGNFGLTPKSNMNYDVMRSDTTDYEHVGKRYLNNNGSGGFNQAFLGLAIGNQRISVGVNMNYQFGSFERNAKLALVTDTIVPKPRVFVFSKSVEASGFFADFGIQYKQPIGRNYRLALGVSYTPKYTLNASRSSLILSTTSTTDIDTIYVNNAEDGTLQMPDIYAFGLSFERNNRWVIGAEYTMSNYKNYMEFGKKDPNLTNTFTFRVGGELIGKRLDNNFMNRLSYRVGYHYGTSYVSLKEQLVNSSNSQLIQYGVSFGIGMPIRRSLSRVDFAVEFGRKGSMKSGQIQENYGRIIVGISAFDRWFMRGKFD